MLQWRNVFCSSAQAVAVWPHHSHSAESFISIPEFLMSPLVPGNGQVTSRHTDTTPSGSVCSDNPGNVIIAWGQVTQQISPIILSSSLSIPFSTVYQGRFYFGLILFNVKTPSNCWVVANCLCLFWVGEGNGTPLQYSWLENPMDGGAWWAAVHGVAKSRAQLSDFTLFFHFHALEKEMATHTSVLAWRIPGMEDPGGLPSMGSHRVGHD